MPNPHRYGLLRPSPAGLFKTLRLPEGLRLTDAPDTDLRPAMAAAGIRHKDQGAFNSCVFCSGTVAAAFLSYKTHPERCAPVFSAFFPYFLVRQGYVRAGDIRTITTDCGATGADFMAVAKAHGLAFEADWTSDQAHFAAKPPATVRAGAMDHQTLESFAIPQNSVAVIRAVLAAKQLPVQIGMKVPPEMEGAVVDRTGHLDSIADETLQNILGLHEVLVVASETIDGVEYFWIWNSWGEGWAKGGNVRIPAKLLARLMIESRVMLKIE